MIRNLIKRSLSSFLKKPFHQYPLNAPKKPFFDVKNNNAIFNNNKKAKENEKEDKEKDREKETQLIFKPKHFRSKDDDVHAQRMLEMMKYETIDEHYFRVKSEKNRFTFDYVTDFKTLDLDELNILNIENLETFHRVPKLQHNLDRLVHRPGIYTMKEVAKLQEDKGEFLKNIPKLENLAMDHIPEYIPPSQDKTLLEFARNSNIKYVMSTSTISQVLSQIYYLLSWFRPPMFDNVFEEFENEPKKYMISQRKPVTNILRKLDESKGIYGLDGDPGIFQYKNDILLNLGRVLERFLTLTPDEFNSSLLKNNAKYENKYVIPDDHHRFMKVNNDICLRSQIDCHSFNPQTKQPFVFEIKTRACCPMRYELANFADFFDYKINNIKGLHSSFEREYYDLIRGAFLKYAFQLKIGRMDGAFMAYHNTQEIFGFEYIKTKEIMERVFGSEIYSDVCFLISSKILTELLNNILKDLEGKQFEMLKLGVYACNFLKKLVVFAELIPEKIEWGQESLIEQTAEIKDEIDYYTKIEKNRNKLYKYNFFIYPFINGVQQKMSNFTFQQHHQLEIKYKFVNCGTPSFVDYMNFLHDAYKLETVNLDLSYSGVWLKR